MKENVLDYRCDCCDSDMEILLTNERGTNFNIICPYCGSEISITLTLFSSVIKKDKNKRCGLCLNCKEVESNWDYGVWRGYCKFDECCKDKYEHTICNCGKFELKNY